MKLLYVTLLAILALSSTGCYKDDYKVVFDGEPAQVEYENSIDMGTDYKNQIFYDLEDKERYTSELIDWDLAFSADQDLPHIRINTGSGWSAYTCASTSIANHPAISSIAANEWLVDNPSGDVSDLALGNFLDLGSVYSKVIILRKDLFNGKFDYYLMRITQIEASKYHFEFKSQNATYVTEYNATIPQSLPRNYYFAKINGNQIDTLNQKVEANKNMGWDFCFTRYSRFFDDFGINYIVTGVLLNPKTTSAYLDSTSKFEEINMSNIEPSRLEETMDVIGYNWKSIDNSYADYTVKTNYNYIISTQEGNYYKLRFTGFYNQNHEKGHPSFEFQKIN